MIAALALLSAALGGGADFLGGAVSRRLPAPIVVLASETVSLLLSVALALTLVRGAVTTSSAAWAAAAGVFAAAGLVAFYTALASGKMSIVAPVAGMGVCMPVLFGLLVRGESPSTAQLVGIVVAVIGIVFVSGPELSGDDGVRPLVLAAIAAVMFGLLTICLAHTSDQSPAATSGIMRAPGLARPRRHRRPVPRRPAAEASMASRNAQPH